MTEATPLGWGWSSAVAPAAFVDLRESERIGSAILDQPRIWQEANSGM